MTFETREAETAALPKDIRNAALKRIEQSPELETFLAKTGHYKRADLVREAAKAAEDVSVSDADIINAAGLKQEKIGYDVMQKHKAAQENRLSPNNAKDIGSFLLGKKG